MNPQTENQECSQKRRAICGDCRGVYSEFRSIFLVAMQGSLRRLRNRTELLTQHTARMLH